MKESFVGQLRKLHYPQRLCDDENQITLYERAKELTKWSNVVLLRCVWRIVHCHYFPIQKSIGNYVDTKQTKCQRFRTVTAKQQLKTRIRIDRFVVNCILRLHQQIVNLTNPINSYELHAISSRTLNKRTKLNIAGY